jgi:hypothetical protein
MEGVGSGKGTLFSNISLGEAIACINKNRNSTCKSTESSVFNPTCAGSYLNPYPCKRKRDIDISWPLTDCFIH